MVVGVSGSSIEGYPFLYSLQFCLGGGILLDHCFQIFFVHFPPFIFLSPQVDNPISAGMQLRKVEAGNTKNYEKSKHTDLTSNVVSAERRSSMAYDKEIRFERGHNRRIRIGL